MVKDLEWIQAIFTIQERYLLPKEDWSHVRSIVNNESSSTLSWMRHETQNQINWILLTNYQVHWSTKIPTYKSGYVILFVFTLPVPFQEHELWWQSRKSFTWGHISPQSLLAILKQSRDKLCRTPVIQEIKTWQRFPIQWQKPHLYEVPFIIMKIFS